MGRQGLRPCTCCFQATATAEATSRAGIPWDGGAVSECGDAVNPSMGAWPRHPCRGHPALRHRPTFDRFPVADGFTPCVNVYPSKSNISTIERRSSTHGVDLRVDQGRHPSRAGHVIPAACGELSKAGWVRLRGREPAATEPTGTYLRRPPQPDPPRLPTGNPLWPWLLLSRLPASGRHYRFGGCRAQPCPSPYLAAAICFSMSAAVTGPRKLWASLPCGSIRWVSGRPRGVAKSAGGSNGSTTTIG